MSVSLADFRGLHWSVVTTPKLNNVPCQPHTYPVVGVLASRTFAALLRCTARS